AIGSERKKLPCSPGGRTTSTGLDGPEPGRTPGGSCKVSASTAGAMRLPARMAKIVKVTFKPLDILVLSLCRKFSGQAGGCQRPVAPGRCQTFPTGPVRASDPPVTSVRDPLVTDARTSSSPSLIRVLVADDHTFVREGIISLLLRSGRCDVVAEGANGVDAVVLARE